MALDSGISALENLCEGASPCVGGRARQLGGAGRADAEDQDIVCIGDTWALAVGWAVTGSRTRTPLLSSG